MNTQCLNTYHWLVSRFTVLLLLALFSSYASAGLLNTFSRLGKMVNIPDVDVPLNKLELPENIKGFAPASIKPGADGEWEITLPDGSSVRVDDLLKQSVGGADKPALVIRVTDLPKDLHHFDSLPHDWPLLIQGRKNRLFELQRGGGAALGYGNIRLPVSNIDDIRDGLWQLQRPSARGGLRYLRLDNKADAPLAANGTGSNIGVETVGANALLNGMQALKNQTLVISGRIVDGRLLGPGKTADGVSLQKLHQLAADNDLQLVILESDRPQAVLKRVAHDMQQARRGVGVLHDSMGDFFNRLVDPANPSPIELRGHRSGEQQMAIQWRAVEAEGVEDAAKLSVEMVQHLPLHLLLKSTALYGPDEARSRELGDRIVPNVPSWIQFYLIYSAILGVIALQTSWRLWKKVWALRPRREYRYLLLFLLLWPLHKLFFFVLFIPMFGGFSFVWLILWSIYRVFHFLLFRPVRWVYRRIAVSV